MLQPKNLTEKYLGVKIANLWIENWLLCSVSQVNALNSPKIGGILESFQTQESKNYQDFTTQVNTEDTIPNNMINDEYLSELIKWTELFQSIQRYIITRDFGITIQGNFLN